MAPAAEEPVRDTSSPLPSNPSSPASSPEAARGFSEDDEDDEEGPARKRLRVEDTDRGSGSGPWNRGKQKVADRSIRMVVYKVADDEGE